MATSPAPADTFPELIAAAIATQTAYLSNLTLKCTVRMGKADVAEMDRLLNEAKVCHFDALAKLAAFKGEGVAT